MDSLFVPDLAPALKHPTILEKFDALQSGESFLLINDHDPIPLYYEMKAEKGDVFNWKKIADGPEVWKIEITKTGGASCAVNTVKEKEGSQQQAFVLNVTLIEPRLKHPTIFKHFDALKAGEAFQILNDHDPKPLYYQMLGERGNIFSWKYLEQGPQWWRVQIRKNDGQNSETVGEIAAKDLRKAEVFKKYGIDFCCGGKKSLKQACEEKGLDAQIVEAELEAAPQAAAQPANNYNLWEPDFLADYIYNQHHLYYYNEVPVLKGLITKVTQHHGDNHPELKYLYALFGQLLHELDVHFAREEKIVFPFIKALVLAKRTGSLDMLNSQPSLTEPIRLMEADHEAAGDILAGMNKLTNDYSLPADACNSYRFLYKKLKELEEDLHQHIHLENNILFPRVLKLEKELNQEDRPA